MDIKEGQIEIPHNQPFEKEIGVLLLEDQAGDPNPEDFELISGRSSNDLSLTDRKTLIAQARKFYFTDPNARDVIELTKFFVIGRGIVFNAQDEDPKVQEFLEKFWQVNKMGLRQKEIVLRTLRDGEVFLRLFKNEQSPLLAKDESGMIAVRFISPTEITEIETDPNDIEKPLRYKREWTKVSYDKDLKTTESQETEILKAEEVLHIKLHSDSDMKFGRSHLEPILKWLRYYWDWVTDRIYRNRISNNIVLEKIVEGAPSRVSSMESSTEDKSTNDNRSVVAKRFPRRGTVVIHNKAIEYKFTVPEIRANDCKEDGRTVKHQICAGVQTPEYMLGDASNANYASTMVSENPFVRKCQDLQHFFEEHFKALFEIVIDNAILTGRLPSRSKKTIVRERNIIMRNLAKIKMLGISEQKEEKEDVDTSRNVDIEFPPMIYREIDKETNALVAQYLQGWVSRQTAQGKLGYEPGEEDRKIDEEQEKDAENDRFNQQRDAVLTKQFEDITTQKKEEMKNKEAENEIM